MERITLIIIFIFCLHVSFTKYVLYTDFGWSSKQLIDPFEEHEN